MENLNCILQIKIKLVTNNSENRRKFTKNVGKFKKLRKVIRKLLFIFEIMKYKYCFIMTWVLFEEGNIQEWSSDLLCFEFFLKYLKLEDMKSNIRV